MHNETVSLCIAGNWKLN